MHRTFVRVYSWCTNSHREARAGVLHLFSATWSRDTFHNHGESFRVDYRNFAGGKFLQCIYTKYRNSYAMNSALRHNARGRTPPAEQSSKYGAGRHQVQNTPPSEVKGYRSDHEEVNDLLIELNGKEKSARLLKIWKQVKTAGQKR